MRPRRIPLIVAPLAPAALAGGGSAPQGSPPVVRPGGTLVLVVDLLAVH